jgi:hypothetical protein
MDLTVTYDEKLEIIIQSFSKAYLLDLAISKADLTKEELERLKKDDIFNARIKNLKDERKEKLAVKLYELADIAYNEGTKLAAIKQAGKLIAPELFNDKIEVSGTIEYNIKKRKQEEVNVNSEH